MVKLMVIEEESKSGLTKGILEALSFQTASSPRHAKKLNPPQSIPKASYWTEFREIRANWPNKTLKKESQKHWEKTNLSDRGSETIDAGLRERGSIVPNELVINRKLKERKNREIRIIKHNKWNLIREEERREMVTGLSGTMCFPTGRPMPARLRTEEADRVINPLPPRIRDAALLNLPAILLSLALDVAGA